MSGRPRKALQDDVILAHYLAGESESALARSLGVSRTAVHRRLLSLHADLRTATEATALRTRQTFNMTEELGNLVDGLLLGDAWLERNKSSEGRLCLSQRGDRGSWLDAVEHILSLENIEVTRSTRAGRRATIKGRTFMGRPEVCLRTHNYQPFTEQRERWYPHGSKQVPQDVHLGPVALAQWYWGDGATSKDGRRMAFHTDGFAEEDVTFLQERIRDLYGWKLTRQARKQRKGSFILALHHKAQQRELVEQIGLFCPPCFNYKLLHIRE